MNHMDADKTYKEKTRRELHKNVTRHIEQMLEAKTHETSAVRTLPISKTILVKWTKQARNYKRSKNVLINDFLLWTPSQGRGNVG